MAPTYRGNRKSAVREPGVHEADKLDSDVSYGLGSGELSEWGPTVDEIEEPLVSLPDDANEALVRGPIG
jgi:hypothetical protein